MIIKCFGCGKPVTSDLPDNAKLDGEVVCIDCLVDEDVMGCLATGRAMIQVLKEQAGRMFDAAVKRWHESDTKLPLHEWVGLTVAECQDWASLSLDSTFSAENVTRVLRGIIERGKGHGASC